MKVFIFVAIVAISGFKCDPISPESVTRTDLADGDVKNLLDEVLLHAPTIESLALLDKIIASVIRTIDAQCVVDAYKNHDMVQRFPFSPIKNNSEPRLLAFVVSCVMCSKKADAFNEFQFEIIQSFRVLYRAFIADDPEYEEFNDMLTCANKYAVEINILDPKLFKFSFEVKPEKMSQCSEWTEQAQAYLDMPYVNFVGCSARVARRSSREKLNITC